MMDLIVAFDPGLSGGAAFYCPATPERVTAEDLPIADGEIDAVTLAARIRQMAPTLAVIERVGSMPKQGVSSTFKFGKACGVIRGIVATLEIPIHMVAPTVWKRHFRLGPDKEEARARALLLFPSVAEQFRRKKDHNRAEAALLAKYGADVILRPAG